MYVTNSYTQIAKDSQVEQMNRPFHGFFFSTFFMGRSGKIRRLCWKKRLKISEIANFESDLVHVKSWKKPRKGQFLAKFKKVPSALQKREGRENEQI